MWERDDAELGRLLGKWLARWRAQVGVSQRSLAARAGISQGGLSRVERGLQTCGSRRLARLIWVLDELSSQGPMGPMAPPPIRPARPEPARAAFPPSYLDELYARPSAPAADVTAALVRQDAWIAEW